MTTIRNYKYIPSYKENGPITPVENECCKEICTMLHETIDTMEKERDYISSMKESVALKELAALPRGFEKRLDNVKNAFIPILGNMSYTLTEEGICKCVERVPEKYE